MVHRRLPYHTRFQAATHKKPVRITYCPRHAVKLGSGLMQLDHLERILRQIPAHILRRVLGACRVLAEHLPERALQRGAQGTPVARAPPGAGRARAAAGCIGRICTSSISLPGTTTFIGCAGTTKGRSTHPLAARICMLPQSDAWMLLQSLCLSTTTCACLGCSS